LTGLRTPLTAGLSLSTTEVTGNGQISPTLNRNLLIGGDVGLLLGIAAALFFGGWRDRLWKPLDVRRTLGGGAIGRVRRRRGSLTAQGGLDEVVAQLELELEHGADASQVVVVTGPASAEEIADIAQALALATESVLAHGEDQAPRVVLGDPARGERAVLIASGRDIWARGHGGVGLLDGAGGKGDEEEGNGAVDTNRLRTPLATCEPASNHVVVVVPSAVGGPSCDIDSLVRAADTVVLVVPRGTRSQVVRRILDRSVVMRRRTAAAVLLG
jgi:hypothetical protein